VSDSGDRISRIRRLVDPAVLLPWSARSKGNHRKWKHLQLTDMNDDSHLAKLKTAGNIGVVLGKPSNGLITIDFDLDDYVVPFLEANPILTKTLRTAAGRGCNLWLRCKTDYPSSCDLLDRGGKPVGEWRADGNQTIISGTHPDGLLYRFVVEAPVLEVNYSDIAWPGSITPPGIAKRQSNRVTEVTESQKLCVRLGELFIKAVEIASTTGFHQNNPALFRLARAMIDIKHLAGTYPSRGNLKQVFALWAGHNRRFWRAGQSWNDYWIEFLQACKDARYGLTEDPRETAFQQALALPPPQEALDCFEDSKMYLFVSFLRQLQTLRGDEAIYASTRWIGKKFGIHHMEASKWIKALIALQILELATPGTTARCPRYYYCPLKGKQTS
jgi:hypothetical protein